MKRLLRWDAAALRAFLLLHHITRKRLALVAGLARETISRACTGSREPSRLARAFIRQGLRRLLTSQNIAIPNFTVREQSADSPPYHAGRVISPKRDSRAD